MSLWSLPFLLVAQDDAKARLKKEIMQKVEQMIREEEERILRSVEALLDKQLGGPKKPVESGKGYLGIRPKPLEPDRRDELKLTPDDGGVAVAEVFPDTPADGNLQLDDVILKLNGATVKDMKDLGALIQRSKAGDELRLHVLRDGKRIDLTVKLAASPDESTAAPAPERKPDDGKGMSRKDLRDRVKEFLEKQDPRAPDARKPEEDKGDFEKLLNELMEQLLQGDSPQDMLDRLKGWLEKKADPDRLKGLLDQAREQFESLLEQLRPGDPAPKKPPAAAPKKKPYIGVRLDELGDDERKKAGVEEGVGLQVAEVAERSPAEKAGINPGDVLVKLGSETIRGRASIQKFLASAKPGEAVEAILRRNGQEVKVRLVLDERKEN